jgi:hypothetical protein
MTMKLKEYLTWENSNKTMTVMGNFTLTKKNLITVVCLLLLNAIGSLQAQTFTTPGTNTYVAPAGVTSITVEAWGGGGHGGTRTSVGVGGGGGGGAYAKKVITVIPGDSYTLNVGAGSSSTAAGGSSWFINTTTLLAKGGGSVTDNNMPGANGGSSGTSIGDVTYSGGNGAGGVNPSYGGGGGAAAGASALGANGSGVSGGIATGGGGDGGDGRAASNGSGLAGSQPGGGGGGAYRSSGVNRPGGNGGDGIVVVTVNAPEIDIEGNSVSIINGDSTPITADWTDFGSTSASGGSVTRVFTIQNTGSATLTIGTVSVSGSGDFSMTSAPAVTLAGGASTTFWVSFDPSGTGVKLATISIANDDPDENPYTFSVRGTGTDPEINLQGNLTDILDGDVTPTTAKWTDFGTTDIATGTLTRTFTVQNKATATSALFPGTITFTGTNASNFSVTTAPGASVAIGSSTTFVITFNPSALGVRTATVHINSNDSDESPYDFDIKGTGAEPEINLVGGATTIADGSVTTSAPDQTYFGLSDIASGTVVRTFTIENKSTATMNLNIGAITISGANAADFSNTVPGSSSLAPNTSTTFSVTFNPSAVGTRNAIISIANNDSDENPYDFAISGVGADPEMDVKGNAVSIVDGDITPSTADSTDFGNVETTVATSVKTFTISNDAAATLGLSLGAITITGTNAADFSASAPGAGFISMGGSTTFTITFNPSSTGVKTATINIASNDSNENPYNFAIQGTGVNPEINLVGNLISIADGDATASVSDNTDFGTVSIDAGSTLVTYTIQNTGVGNMTLGAISFSGVDAGDFSVSTAPATTVAGGSSTTVVVSFHPSSVGTKSATLSIINDDANENPYDFAITGFGVRTYADTDGDAVSDNFDYDDDNDGILDTTEQTECVTSPFASSITYTFLNETFGTGTTRGLININIPGATCSYCFEDGIVGPDTAACPSQSSKILDDGEYCVVHKIAGTLASDPENIHGDLAWNGLVDHTPSDTNGRMAVFNASYTPGIFYETTITGIIPNVTITYSFWALNIMSQSIYSGTILPNISVEFLDTSGTLLSTFNTGDIGRCTGSTALNTCANSEWQQYSTSVNLGNVTSFTIRFKNNAPGGGGNDLAIDDITLKQQYCDRDSDGIANLFDLDSDNDGVPDVEEASYKNMSSGKSTMDKTLGTWADTDHNGMADSIDTAIAGGTYVLPDTDGDGTKDFQDLDCDNDSIFDVDESGILNGDGDINGDGFGDGIDTDKDGILDLFDTSATFGTAVRSYAADTDANGTQDYMQLDSNNDGVKDIVGTLYTSFDTNSDGKIDGTTDVDKDGILDSFDTKTTALGSPRDISKKLFLDFDGRNDYGEAPQLLSGLAKSTIMGWIKLNGPFTGTGFVIGQDNFNLKIDVSAGNKLIATAKGQTITYSTALSVDRWYHICAVYDGASSTEKLKLYVNGQQETTSNAGALAGVLAVSTAKFTFGKTPGATTEYFKGSIDEVRVFNTALTSDQIQKMVYQEIKQNGTAIRGEIVPKDIESSLWANVLAYYRMDAYKDDVIDNYTSASIDSGVSATFARIYNVKNIKYQLAPMPFVTTHSLAVDLAVSQNNYVNGVDVYNYEWSILQVKHNITLPYNMTNLGLFVDPSVNLVLNNDNMLKNTWYFQLNGKVDLQGRSQLVQTATSDLEPTSAGYIERDQQGMANKFNYNYWSSPVGAINAATNNNNYTVAGVFKDGTNPANPQNLNWTSSLNSSATSPITLSSYWIFKFQNVTNSYSNWASVGPNGSLVPGQGYTLKGSNASTATQNYVFVGKPNNGAITSPIAANNLNLCGNPYASAIDADKFITDNLGSLTGTLYFWEHFTTNNTHNLADYQGGYATRTLVGGTPPVSPSTISSLGSSTRVPGQYIPVGQGFFVTGNSAGGTIKFNNAQRGFVRENNAASNIMFREVAPVVLQTDEHKWQNNNEDEVTANTYAKLRLGFNSSNNYHRQILIGFMDDKATAGVDPGYDAVHIDSQPNDMYFVNGSAKLNIQGDGYFNTANIYPLGVKVGAAGTVSFIIDAKENFSAGQTVYIYDNVTAQYHDITDQKFEIALPIGTIEDRFSLRFTNGLLGVNHVNAANNIFVAYANTQSTLNIKNNLTDVSVETVALFNMLGQQVSVWNVENQDQHNVMIPVKNLATGTYIVKMKTTSGDISKKIIVK